MEILWIALILVGIGVVVFFTKKIDGEGKNKDDNERQEKK